MEHLRTMLEMTYSSFVLIKIFCVDKIGAIVHGGHNCFGEIGLQALDDVDDAAIREKMGGHQVIEGIHHTRPGTVQ